MSPIRLAMRWLQSRWSRRYRTRARAFDASFLWPAIHARCEGDFERFIDVAALHMTSDPVWIGWEHEWIDADVTPWAWWRANAQEKP